MWNINCAITYIYVHKRLSCLWQVYPWFKDKYVGSNHPCVCLTVARPTNWQRGWQVFMGSLFNPLLNEFRVYKLMISLKLDANHLFFSLHDLEIRWITSKNNRAPLLGCIELCALFQSRQWIQTELQSGKAQFGSKLAIFFLSRVTLKFDAWPCKTKGHPFYGTSFVHHFSHRLIQTGVTIRIRPIWAWGEVFLSLVTLKFDGSPWKTIRAPLLYAMSNFVHHVHSHRLIRTGVKPGNAKFRCKSAIFCPMWPWNLTDDLRKQ